MDQDIADTLTAQVRKAAERRLPLCLRGSGSKEFLGRTLTGATLDLDVTGHRGIVDYEPSELMLRARAGTPLHEVESLLAAHGQMLPFEPPHFGPHATLGGTVAAGLSGPRRMQAGSVRDAMLGVTLLDGRGERLHFGGQVMKNVAGFDLTRPMAGALGTLGLLLDVSLRVLPRPATEITLSRSCSADEALTLMRDWARQPLPVSAIWHADGQLHARLSGGPAAVRSARDIIGGDELDGGEAFWTGVREQRMPMFTGDRPVWRIAVPPATPVMALEGAQAIEWSGALRWLCSDVPAEKVRAVATQAGGHATLFRGGDRNGEVYQRLSEPLMQLESRIKQTLDPHGILNPGRLWPMGDRPRVALQSGSVPSSS